MLLDGKVAVVYGGGGAIGGAVAEGLAREGAHVFLAGRTAEPVARVAERITAAGGRAEAAVVDALDAEAVEAHADQVVSAAGGLHISFNSISHGDVQGTPMVEMDVDDYMAPIVTGVRTNFLTWKAAGPRMAASGGGVILLFGGGGPPIPGYSIGGLQTDLEALEAMRRQFSQEMGAQGVRVITLRTGGIPEGIPDDFAYKSQIEESIVEQTMLGRAATLRDVADVAAFVASDRARTMTAATVNVSCGSVYD